MIQVVRVRTCETLCHPDVSSLIMRGARHAGLVSDGAVLAELSRDVAAAHVGLFIGFRDHDPQTVAVGHLPTSAFHLAPTITLAYSDGAARDLVVETGRRLREWIMAAGFDHALTNNLWHTDRSFLRGFSHFGKGKTIGSAVCFGFGV